MKQGLVLGATAMAVSLAAVWPAPAHAQVNESAQRLFEAGQYAAAIEEVAGQGRTPDSADAYLAAQAYLRLERPDGASVELTRLKEQPDRTWQLIAESANARVGESRNRPDSIARALEAALEATKLSPNQFFAHYQLGLVKAEQQDWAATAAAFERAAQLDSRFAYAHYYAGYSYSRLKRVDRMAEHFERFLKLAPKAPERPAVESIMRTLRGR